MPKLQIIGVPQSNFVWTCRLAAEEKGVAYSLVPERPHTAAVNAIHPFGKIPVVRHGDLSLCETRAICGYIDQAFDGPPLIPINVRDAALTEQWISLVTTGFDLVFARAYLIGYFFSGLADGAPDRARIDGALPSMQKMLRYIESQLAGRDHIAIDRCTLADFFLLPLIHYLRMMPESGQMLKTASRLDAWYARLAARPSFAATVPPPMPALP